MNDRTGLGLVASAVRRAQMVVPCGDVTATLDFFVERLGFRVDEIFPADSPSVAVISGHGITLRLERSSGESASPTLRLLCDLSALPAGTQRDIQAPNGMRVDIADADPPLEVPGGEQEFVISRGDDDLWGTGRATMQYRDLVPSRLGGRFVVSHIRIPQGGPVPDYVHYHRVRFQMIFCKAGWVKVVYEDQGPPFVMETGDCVLQPPQIRHRVLEASPGLEVIEVGCPAVHETHADHDMRLPNGSLDTQRMFNGQRFMRHVAREGKWSPWRIPGFEARDTGIAAATNGMASVRVVRSTGPVSGSIQHEGEFLFFFVLRGRLGLRSEPHGEHELQENASCVIPTCVAFELAATAGLEMLEVVLPAR